MKKTIFLLCLIGGCTARTEDPDAGVDANVIPLEGGAMPDAGWDAGRCMPGTIDCFGTCTRVAWDSLNCGSCGNICPPGLTCSNGLCDCMEPMTSCRGVCTDLQTDIENCGTCENVCAASDMCLDGECILICNEPMTICRDPVTMEASCVDLQTDPMNCSACNSQCVNGASCIAGRCTCPPDHLNCGGRCVNITTDPENCGSCGITCGTGGSCTDARCMCGTDRLDCGGRCIDPLTDRFNCGSCSRGCGLGESCVGGLCDCPEPRRDCGMGCTDLQTDPNHCGACGTTCGMNGVCRAGVCECASGYMLCGGSCRDTTNDINNCGGCGTVCPPLVGGVCRGGTCGCPAGLMNCGGSCVDPSNDRNNCGGCGMRCPGAQVCYMSACTSSPPTRYTQTVPASVPFINACTVPGHTEHLPMTDDSSVLVALPFAFRYWATDLPAGSMINVSTNGFISMDGVINASLSGTVPSASTPNAVIAAHWGDNQTRGPICVATVGTAPNRQFVVLWNDTHYYANMTPRLTYEIILYEGSNFIDLVYETMTGARAQTMGVENQTGMAAVNACPGGAATCIPSPGQRVRFLPAP